MSISRIVIAAALVAGFASLAQAQTRQVEPSASDFNAVQDGRSVAYDGRSDAYRGAPVAAIVSHTVMGLSTPY